MSLLMIFFQGSSSTFSIKHYYNLHTSAGRIGYTEDVTFQSNRTSDSFDHQRNNDDRDTHINNDDILIDVVVFGVQQSLYVCLSVRPFIVLLTLTLNYFFQFCYKPHLLRLPLFLLKKKKFTCSRYTLLCIIL